MIKTAIIAILAFTTGGSWMLHSSDETINTQGRIESKFSSQRYDYTLIKQGNQVKLTWRDICEASGTQPVASAGSDVKACVGAAVTLNSRGSYDPLGMTLSRSWYWLTRPLDSLAVISGADAEMCHIVPDKPGEYTVGLEVWTSDNRRATDSVSISATVCDYTPRAAIAGPADICGKLPLTIKLDGSKSHTKEGQIVKYYWQVESAPGGYVKYINNGQEIDYIIELSGNYVFSLVVENSLRYLSDKVYFQVRISDGEPPTITGQGERSSYRTLLIKKDTATINVRIRFESDCKKEPVEYVYLRRAENEAQFGPARLIPADTIKNDPRTGIASLSIYDDYLLGGVAYIYLVAGISEEGKVLTFMELAL